MGDCCTAHCARTQTAFILIRCAACTLEQPLTFEREKEKKEKKKKAIKIADRRRRCVVC